MYHSVSSWICECFILYNNIFYYCDSFWKDFLVVDFFLTNSTYPVIIVVQDNNRV